MSAERALELASLAQYARDRPECLDILTPRERLIFVARHTECAFQAMSFDALGKEIGVSRECVRQLLELARAKLTLFRERDPRRCPHCAGKGWI